jgi:hypothetical protein
VILRTQEEGGHRKRRPLDLFAGESLSRPQGEALSEESKRNHFPREELSKGKGEYLSGVRREYLGGVRDIHKHRRPPHISQEKGLFSLEKRLSPQTLGIPRNTHLSLTSSPKARTSHPFFLGKTPLSKRL